jgi:hypothetical protein
VSFVENQQLVKPGRSRSPVANDKDWRFPDLRTSDGSSVKELLHQPHHSMKAADERNDEGDVPVFGVNRKTASPE